MHRREGGLAPLVNVSTFVIGEMNRRADVNKYSLVVGADSSGAWIVHRPDKPLVSGASFFVTRNVERSHRGRRACIGALGTVCVR